MERPGSVSAVRQFHATESNGLILMKYAVRVRDIGSDIGLTCMTKYRKDLSTYLFSKSTKAIQSVYDSAADLKRTRTESNVAKNRSKPFWQSVCQPDASYVRACDHAERLLTDGPPGQPSLRA